MQPHALTLFAAQLTEQHEAPLVLDVERSVQVHKPSLTGTISPASYYLRPAEGMSAEKLIELFESTPGYEQMNLTLISILGLDTYHQPLISVDDFARKYFADNLKRIVRVVGKSDPAIDAMEGFVEGLKRPFSAEEFPHHGDFAVSGYRPPSPGKSTEVKLLFLPADPTQLMRVEHLVNLHLAECNLAREIGASRHYTREQPPELILSSAADTPTAHAYLEALANSLPRASKEDVEEATLASVSSVKTAASEPSRQRGPFGRTEAAVRGLSGIDLKKKVTENLAHILRQTWASTDLEVRVGQNGTAVEVKFPRSAKSLWLASSFDERKHIQDVRVASLGVKAMPELREGWGLHYRFDGGTLQVRTVDPEDKPLNGAKAVTG